MQKLIEAMSADESLTTGRSFTIETRPPPLGKDYNDALTTKLKEKQEQATPRRLKAAISI
jgi:hypothetical protein